MVLLKDEKENMEMDSLFFLRNLPMEIMYDTRLKFVKVGVNFYYPTLGNISRFNRFLLLHFGRSHFKYPLTAYTTIDLNALSNFAMDRSFYYLFCSNVFQ